MKEESLLEQKGKKNLLTPVAWISIKKNTQVQIQLEEMSEKQFKRINYDQTTQEKEGSQSIKYKKI